MLAGAKVAQVLERVGVKKSAGTLKIPRAARTICAQNHR
jgi:hypothetical protein